jgi:hypothetical protein
LIRAFELRKLALLGTALLAAVVMLDARAVSLSAKDAKPASALWSLKPVRNPNPPRVKNSGWVRNSIDRFILAKLESERISPSPEADRPTLIRRLSFDLIGLPPAAAEVDAFVNDKRPDAYERWVDRLLASPHFGERWGRHWLDLARYADSDGYEKDNVRPWAWRWRNWVIDAVNRDMPFDQFTIEQLAGDLLPNATLDQKIATGFHRNTLTNTEGGTDQEEFRVKANVDRVNTTGTIWMGLTVQCAQCHNHKYDPISQQEFYQLFAFYNSVNEVNISAPLPDEQAAYEKAKSAFDTERAQVKARVDGELDKLARDVLPERQRRWEADAAKSAVRWTVLRPTEVKSDGGATLKVLDDASIFASGKNPESDTYRLVAPVSGSIAAIRLEALSDSKLPSKGPGRTGHGNFVVNGVQVSVAAPGAPVKTIELGEASADYSQNGFPPAKAFDADPAEGWAVGGQEGRAHVLVARAKESIAAPAGSTLTIVIPQKHGSNHTLGRFRLSITASSRAAASLTADAVADALTTSEASRTSEQKALLAVTYRAQDPDVALVSSELAKIEAKAPKPPATMAQTLVRADKGRQTHIMIRGDFQQHGPEVFPRTPDCLPGLTTTNSEPTRLDFAKWLVDPRNPLTPRVTVNRVWMHLFGRGIVGSVDDFGTRGEKPTHPELLDWLATSFVSKDKWSLKFLIRRIVMSATYRQSSRYRPELAGRDANNLWLARQNRFRLEAEGVRDAFLAASGLLNSTIGGPSVRPPMPSGIAELGYAGSVRWQESKGVDKYRRGLYVFFQRTVPYPMLTTFDTPDMNVCAAKRERSNTPLQALTLLNDPVFVECAQALGRRIVRDAAKSPKQKIEFAFKTCLGRSPTPVELRESLTIYEQMRKQSESDLEAAADFAGEHAASNRDVVELSAWTAVARIVLNLDEFVTRE